MNRNEILEWLIQTANYYFNKKQNYFMKTYGNSKLQKSYDFVNKVIKQIDEFIVNINNEQEISNTKSFPELDPILNKIHSYEKAYNVFEKLCSYLERIKRTLRIENFDEISNPITKTINNKFNEISKLRNDNFKNCITEIENSSFTLGQLTYIQSNLYIKTRSYYTNINETNLINLIEKLQNI